MKVKVMTPESIALFTYQAPGRSWAPDRAPHGWGWWCARGARVVMAIVSAALVGTLARFPASLFCFGGRSAGRRLLALPSASRTRSIYVLQNRPRHRRCVSNSPPSSGRLQLSGIRRRRRRRRCSFVSRPGLVALRYAGSKFMELEAGDDWMARLWKTYQQTRIVFIDCRD